MKRAVTLLLIVLVCLSLVACGQSENLATSTSDTLKSLNSAEQALLGSWVAEDSSMVFNEDGTCINHLGVTARWSASGDMVTITSDRSVGELTFTIEDNVLTLTDEYGNVTVLKKQ